MPIFPLAQGRLRWTEILADAQEFTLSTWTEVLTPYMTNLFPSEAVANDETLEKFRLAAEKATVGIDDTNRTAMLMMRVLKKFVT